MTVQEMYQEMQEQLLEDSLLGYIDLPTYDDAQGYQIEVDYTTQE